MAETSSDPTAAAEVLPPTFVDLLRERLGSRLLALRQSLQEITIDIDSSAVPAVATQLRDDPAFKFEIMVDLCGVDYLGYGGGEWSADVSSTGFSRGVQGENGPGRFDWDSRPESAHVARRFAVVMHLLSITHNHRLRVRYFAAEEGLPMVPSVVNIWSAANWFEREAFDLFGIVFDGHPDLRRILTDYGFIGHPLRKDFPLSGNVEVRFDPALNRVIYEPVSIEPRVGVPRVVRDDSRYAQEQAQLALKAK
jgi:NADH-quinone oxidoreductase subunit C